MSTEPVAAAPPEAFTVWFRPNRRSQWEAVGTAPTTMAALDVMLAAGKRHGQWLVRPTGSPPEPKPVPR